MLFFRFTNLGFEFSVKYNNLPLNFNEWDATDNCIYYMPLSTLVYNGYATVDNNKCFVPFDSCYLLTRDDMDVLGMPSFYPCQIRVKSDGDFRSCNLRYILEYLTHIPDGEMLNVQETGNVIEAHNNKFLLSQQQYALKKLIDKFNNIDSELKTMEYNLRCFAEIKKAAKAANAYLDAFLENEEVYVPDQIKLELGREGNRLTILPTVNITEKEKFKSTFDRQRRLLDVYPISDTNGNRTRIVLSPEQKKSLQPIKEHKCRFEENDKIFQIIEHPTEFFDPDQFDLSDFYSDRVIDLGFYKPKFYPFISPYKSQWIVGCTVEHPKDGTSRISIKTEQELAELKSSITKAKENESHVIEYHDSKLSMEDALFLQEMAENQFLNPKQAICINSDKKGKRVLIIEENAELTGYEEQHNQMLEENKYPFYRNENLRSHFSLKTHQVEGIAWLQHLLTHDAPGCLMADDMGLGKTLQLLYFIDWHSQTYPSHKPYLIIAPVSLLENWSNEYERFFSRHMNITIVSNDDIPRKFNHKAIDFLQKREIVFTNYETIRNAQLNFAAVDFDIIVLDEAQRVKTPGAMTTNAVKALKGKFKVAMTGTPVENTLLDLWCIMDFCVPGLLGNAKEFARKYQNPLRNSDTDLTALGNEIHNILGSYFIRRMKFDVAKDLPHKIEIKEGATMSSIQELFYKNAVSQYSGGRGAMLQIIHDIREISEHPYLHDNTSRIRKIQELIDDSARMSITIRFLDRIRNNGEKVIIFTERKETQNMLQRVVREVYGFSPRIINGDTPTFDQPNIGKLSRQSAIDNFQKDSGFSVIIMSPIAAGMGLNVTAANHVIHYNRHWNPAKENQATDRAYRIGQDKDVYVYYPMATGSNFKSFDITLDELLSRKNILANSTIFPTERIEIRPEDFESILNIPEA